MFASRQINVIGVDISQRAITTINEGKIHIIEPELDVIVHAVVTAGYLRATDQSYPADAFLIAVPTPFKTNHEPDLSYVKAAAESIAPVLKKGNLIILESTSPVGTTEQVAQWLATARPDLRFPVAGCESPDVHVAYCPERVLPGHVVRELVENDRIIGGLTPACARRAAELYRVFVEGNLHITDARTAEMCKLTENAFRDVNIAFANELSVICDKLQIDVWELIRLANRHPRVNILSPGCGVGGHCIAVDPWFIVDKTPTEARLIRTSREVNDGKPEWVLRRVEQAVQELVSNGRNKEGVKVAVFGLAFKPDIDDLRESPALKIAHSLRQDYGHRLMIVEPHIDVLPPSLVDCDLVQMEQAAMVADVLVILVRHTLFCELSINRLHARQRVVDLVGLLAPLGTLASYRDGEQRPAALCQEEHLSCSERE